jgi:hypothetical protein
LARAVVFFRAVVPRDFPALAPVFFVRADFVRLAVPFALLAVVRFVVAIKSFRAKLEDPGGGTPRGRTRCLPSLLPRSRTPIDQR